MTVVCLMLLVSSIVHAELYIDGIKTLGDIVTGRITTSGGITVTKDAIGVTPVDTNGIMIRNTTAAAVGAQQYSPPLVFQGQGWKTDATAASQKVEFMMDVRPVQGAAAPTGYWGLYPSIADAAYSATPAIAVTSAGYVGIGGAVPMFFLSVPGSIGGFTYAGTYVNPTAGGLSLSGNDSVRLQIAGVEGARLNVTGFGINTALPQSLLDAQGASGAAGILTLATKTTAVTAAQELGRINFNAPLEASTTDAILPGASIWAVAEAEFTNAVNATSLVFATGASEAAVEKMRLTSDGLCKILGANITAGSGSGITVNSTGNVNSQLYKVTTTYAAYTDADTTKGIVIATLPAKTKIVGFYADTTAAYTGGATNAATLVVGITAESAAEIIASHDVFAGAILAGDADAEMGTSMTRAAAIQGGYLPSWSGTTAIYATLVIVNDITSNLTAGSTTFYIQTERY